jgi:hypothetical protein
MHYEHPNKKYKIQKKWNLGWSDKKKVNPKGLNPKSYKL